MGMISSQQRITSGIVPWAPFGQSGANRCSSKGTAHIVRSGIRNLDDNASGARLGAWPPNEEVFQDFPIVCGGEGLFANLTMNQVIYDLRAGTHAHHLVVRLTLPRPQGAQQDCSRVSTMSANRHSRLARHRSSLHARWRAEKASAYGSALAIPPKAFTSLHQFSPVCGLLLK
jgi:hypothetical protein